MRLAHAIVLVGASACGQRAHSTPDSAAPIDAEPIDAELIDAAPLPPDANPLEPLTLFGTGLCTDVACSQTTLDAREYAPQFPLWVDTASKRRWIYLPPGTAIDTSDMNHWVFPQGTKLWKEFTRDGVRVETRYIVKESASDTSWFYASYQWNATNDDTMLWNAAAGVQGVDGTQHDIPSRAQCKSCHENLVPSRVLGFQAIQLDYTAAAGLLDLDGLIAQGFLTAAPAGASSPHFPLPGSATDQAALGYLHANCGHCHNPTSSFYNNTKMVLRLDTTLLATTAVTPTFATTINVAGSTVVDNGMTYKTVVIPDDPDDSILIERMNSTNSQLHMPATGAALVDPDGQTILRTWINSLPPTP